MDFGTTDLKSLLQIHNELYKRISEAAVLHGNGTHPKHRLTRYHDFFVNNVEENESVLDLGSGRGDVTYDVARKTNGDVFGLELNWNNVRYAQKTYHRYNLVFHQGDMRKDIPNYRTFDIVILSNVLEHLDDRVNLLKTIVDKCKPSKILFRVPYFEREWIVAMKKELGVNYFLDNTHKIEYEIDEFEKEMRNAGLEIIKQRINWGEIWAVCKPLTK